MHAERDVGRVRVLNPPEGSGTGPRRPERVGENLNRALDRALAGDRRVTLLGEDVLDPYGGAFKISRGLSTRHPRSVLGTPISESGVLGVAAGLALCGERPIVEVMFGDFLALGFDQLLNFATKSVAMYGHPVPMHLVVRCPVGGNRGYGPTHSQSPHKHLLGIAHLALFEVSQFHDNVAVLSHLLARGEPCVLFEDKSLYTRPMYAAGAVDRGAVDELFAFDYPDPDRRFARVRAEGSDGTGTVIITPGGTFGRALAAARELFLGYETDCQILVPSQLYPLDLEPLLPSLERAERICVVEEGIAGAGWASDLAGRIHDRLWGKLRDRVVVVTSRASVIPAAAHLEREVLVQAETIRDALLEAARA
jgi:pyruvate/2-oxoglutarate/acetoin dehydrogenase E1 component